MLLNVFRFLLWQVVVVLVAAIEQVIAIPFLTMTVLVVALSGWPTLWLFSFLIISSLLLAALLGLPWLVVWLIVTSCLLIFRSNVIGQRSLVVTKLAVIAVAAVVLSLLRQPSITSSFILYSLLSLVLSWYIVRYYARPQRQGLDVSSLRFKANQE